MLRNDPYSSDEILDLAEDPPSFFFHKLKSTLKPKPGRFYSNWQIAGVVVSLVLLSLVAGLFAYSFFV